MPVHQDRVFDDIRSTVHEYARILRRRWRLALLGTSIVGSLAFWVSQYLPREYSTFTLFERRDDAVLRDLIHSNSPYSFAQLKSSIKLDMTGSRALAEAASELGLIPPDAITSQQALSNEERQILDQALAAYDLKASVNLVHSSPSHDTIELRCTANDPQAACRFATALRDGYIQLARQTLGDILSSTRDFFANEVERYQQQVNEANQRLKDQFSKFPGVDPSDPVSVGTRLDAMRNERIRLVERQAELEAQITARERFLTSAVMTESAEPRAATRQPALNAPPALPDTSSAIDKMIAQLEQEISDALVLKQMTNEHPKVKALRRKLENLYAVRQITLTATTQASVPAAEAVPEPDTKQRLRRQDPRLAAERLRVELELDALRAQLAIVAEHLSEAETRVNEFTALYEKLIQTNDEFKLLEDQLAQDTATMSLWRQKLMQLERILAAEAQQRGTQFTLIEEPKENTRAIKPRAAAIFVICLGCGLAAAALLVALAELLDRSFRSAAQVTRALGLPVLECIGLINTPRVRAQQLRRRLIWTPALCLLLGCLLFTGTLAYASVEKPALHRRAIAALDNILQTVGAPPTSLAGDQHQ